MEKRRNIPMGGHVEIFIDLSEERTGKGNRANPKEIIGLPGNNFCLMENR
jgi:hypothetical protein